MIDFWIVRKGEDARKVAPEDIADAIANHPDSNPQCLLCDDDHFSAAVGAFRSPEDGVICTAGVCAICAGRSDGLPRWFSGWVVRLDHDQQR
jgi:hypothetical protein